MEAMTAWQELANMEAYTAFYNGINTFNNILSVAIYVLTALALYAVAERRGISKPWLAWIPIANIWLLGSISDHYQQTVKQKKTNRRKLLVILNIAIYVVAIVVAISFLVIITQTVFELVEEGYTTEEILAKVFFAMGGILLIVLPIMAISIVYHVFFYITIYDYYMSCDPQNAVLFLVLSIVFRYVQPILLFVVRNKDLGMPRPQPQQPYYQPPQELDQQ